VLLIDVRKAPARGASGLTIPLSRYCHPFDAMNWVESLDGRSVIVFCVHGHEVSKAVCGYLRDEGVDARFLAGGFEAWRKAGLPVESVEG
jgi:Fe-Mn family superoxide dismutase